MNLIQCAGLFCFKVLNGLGPEYLQYCLLLHDLTWALFISGPHLDVSAVLNVVECLYGRGPPLLRF